MGNNFFSFLLKITLLAILVLSIVQIKLKFGIMPPSPLGEEKVDSTRKTGRILEIADSLFAGDTKFAKELVPDSLFAKGLSWKSEKPEIASVEKESGKIVSLLPGNCEIYGINNKDTIVKMHVSVSPSKQKSDIKLTSITMNKEAIKDPLEPNKKVSIAMTFAPEDATNKALSWGSSNNEVATVDNNGTVTTHKNGTAIIIAKAKDGSGLKDSTKIVVKVPTPKPVISWEKSTQSLKEGSSFQLKIKTSPQNVKIQWKSSDPSIASIDSKGKVSAKKSGTIKITAIVTTADGISSEDTIVIKVSAAPRPAVKVVSQLNLGIGTYFGNVTNNKPDGGYIKMNNCTLTHRNGKKIVFTSGDRVDVNSYSQDPSSGRITIMGDITRVSGEIERNVIFYYYKD